MQTHDEIRAQLARDIDAFFANGGAVQTVTAADNAGALDRPMTRAERRRLEKAKTTATLENKRARK